MPRNQKPVLVKVGNQFIDPNDVAAITKCKRQSEAAEAF